MIKQETAAAIWRAYREIEAGQKLLADMTEIRKREQLDKTAPTIRDAFGRPQHLQLGIPSGKDAHRILDVSPALAESVIRAHIENKRGTESYERKQCADAIEALELQLKNASAAAIAEAAEVDRLQAEVERLNMALHGYQVAIETAEESLKDRVALAMEVDRLSAAGVSHCGHRPPCIECSKYAAPIPQQVATAQEILPVDLRIDMWPPAPTSGMVVGMSKGVMITHISTGIEATCDTERSQHRNRDAAFEQLKKKLAAAPQPKETK